MELVLSTLSDNALYLYQYLSIYLIGFKVIDLNSRIDARVVTNVYGRTYERTNGRKIGSLYRARRDKKGVSKSKQYFLYPCIKYEYLRELLDF